MIGFELMQRIRGELDRWEQPIRWMYLDSEGLVTVGCGTMLPNAAAAKRVSFVHGTSLQVATPAEVEAAWNSLHSGAAAQKAAASSKKFNAKHYADKTDLRITDASTQALRDDHIKADYVELKKIYLQFDSFPDDAKVALFDMIYNVGPGRNKTRHHRASGLRNFVAMNAAINAGKWSLAADRCTRHGIPAQRNRRTAELFRNSAPPQAKPAVSLRVVA
jgi:GH24 family phage-related lysozyme (muramidase)